MTPGRLPYAPLERILRLRWDAQSTTDVGGVGAGDHGLWCDQQAAIQLGVNYPSVPKYRANGLRPDIADRLACHIGLHPLLVWGNAWMCAEIGSDMRRWARTQDSETKAA